MKKLTVLTGLVAGLLLAGCSSTSGLPKTEKVSAKDKPACCVKKDSTAAVAPSATKKPSTPSVLAQMKEEAARLVKVYYFDFDKDLVKTEDLPHIQSNSAFMNKYPGVSVKMTGHADDRGSAEYNLALGQRRAATVENLFKATGVNKSRIESISMGEERPQAAGTNEQAYSKNRRVELEYFIQQ